MALISITRLRVRFRRFLPQFLWYALRSARQARRAPGCFAAEIFRDADRAFWTATAWTDVAAMRAFMLSEPHRLAMPKLKEWCDEAFLVHWEQDTTELPSWREAHRQLTAEGRRSAVNHPSPRHLAMEIPEPRG